MGAQIAGGKGTTALAFAIATGVGLGAGLFFLDGSGPRPSAPSTERAAPPAATPAAASSTALGVPSAAPSDGPAVAPAAAEAPPPAATSASPADSAPAPAPAPAGDSPTACLGGFFPEETFLAEPPLAFVCEETDALASVTRLKKEVVVAGRGRGATGGMKEWAVLGFYELAALSVMRGRCCPGAAPLTAPAAAETCGSIGEALAALATSAHEVPPAAERAAAVKRFDDSVRCLMKFRQTTTFGYQPLLGSEASTFEKVVSRVGGG